jgi:hypothetical protein
MSGPMNPRDQALKRATRAQVAAAGGCEGAAPLCRLGKSQLAAAGSINEPDRWLPVDVLRDLMGVTAGHADQLAVLQHLAAEVGAVVLPGVDVAAVTLDPAAAIIQISSEANDVVAQLARFVPGRSDPRALIKEADELQLAAARLRAAAAQLEREAM